MAEEALNPGVFVVERPGQPSIQGVGASAGGFIIESEWGPDDIPILITSPANLIERFGRLIGGLYGPRAIRDFFFIGGSRCYVVRATDNALAASGEVGDLDSGGTVIISSIDITAKYKGARGNRLRVTTEKARSTLAAPFSVGTVNSLDLVSALQFRVGDLLVIGNPEDGDQNTDVGALDVLIVSAIARGAGAGGSDRVGVTEFTASASVSDGTRVSTSTTHKLHGTLAASAAAGATILQLRSVISAQVGQRIVIADISKPTGANKTHITSITEINGNFITITDAIPAGMVLVAGDVVASLEFDILVAEEGTALEPRHQYLSMESNNTIDYINNRLSGDGNASAFLDVVKGDTTASPTEEQLPLPFLDLAIAGGSNGTLPITDATIYQDAALLFDVPVARDMLWLAAPGKATAFQQAIVDYCITRGTTAAVVDPELTDDTPNELLDFIQVQLARDHSQIIPCGPWILTVDPVTSQDSPAPFSGHMMGIMSKIARDFGIHYSPLNQAITNIRALILNTDDQNHGILNQAGFNLVRFFQGRGFRIMGGRTLQSLQDGFHFANVRNLVNYIKIALKIGNQDFIGRLINDDTLASIQRVNENFLTGLWKAGALRPRSDRTKAFFVKVDSETTTDADVNDGRVNVEIFIQPVKPLEKLFFRINITQSDVSVSEFVQ